jgi:heterodisulfide reductase subunit A2
MARKPKIGVYICHCGINIANTVDVEAVRDFAQGLPGVTVARDYTYMCSDPGQGLIVEDIGEYGLDKVVVSACSPRMHEPTFRTAIQGAGLNPYCLEIANIREQCSWVHPDKQNGTAKAKSLVASAVAKAALLEPLEAREVGVVEGALVVGGGVAGIHSALDIADAGFPVFLVEQSDHLGGHAADLSRTYPRMEYAAELLEPALSRLMNHPHATVLLNSRLKELSGYVGNFEAVVETRTADSLGERKIRIGGIVIATGYAPFDAHLKPEFGYGQYPQVITALEFERMVSSDGPTGGRILVNGKEPRDVVFIKCVGSRDKTVGNPYCSRVCCMYTAKQAHLVQQELPAANVTVLYMDVRAHGKGFEEYYDLVRETGVYYRRGNPAEILQQGERVVVRVEDTFLGEFADVQADLVVLATGMVPRRETGEIAQLLKLSQSADGFLLEAHPKLRPVDTASDGIFLAGCAQGPKDITDTIAQAKAAAASAMIPFLRGKVMVESATCTVDEELCAGCGMCEEVCPYGALRLDVRHGVMRANVVLCKGCGSCAAICPSNAITLMHFTPRQVMAQVDALMML